MTGISPAWVANLPAGYNIGDDWTNLPETTHYLFVYCQNDFVGDIWAAIHLNLVAEVVEPPPNHTVNIEAICDSAFLGDVNPERFIDVSCFIQNLLADINPIIDMTDVFVVTSVS